ncbi:MAG: membrane protein insertion efficiency factor YidD [Rickettsiaceae bacterium]
MKHILILFIKFYQFFISPWLGKNCRFYPTCSEYAYESISTYGTIKGLFFAFRRLLKCHPFADGGYDPVPKKPK